MIETERLILRPPELAHIEPLMAVFADPEAVRFLGDGCPRSIEQVTASFEKRARSLADHGVTLWTVERKDPEPGQPAIIGDCGILPAAWHGPDFEIAYRYRTSAWGHGYATEAARATLDHAWATTSLSHVIGLAYSDNTASRHVLTKLGFAHQGTTERYYDSLLEYFLLDRGSTHALSTTG